MCNSHCCCCCLVAKLSPTLCNPMDYSLPVSSIHGTRQTFVGKVMSLLFNMLSRLVTDFLPRSKRLLIPWLQSPSTVIFMHTHIYIYTHPCRQTVLVLVAQPCPTLCDPVDCSLPGSSAHGILQARILGCLYCGNTGLVAIPYFRGSFWPRDQTHIVCVSCTGRWILYFPTWEALQDKVF